MSNIIHIAAAVSFNNVYSELIKSSTITSPPLVSRQTTRSTRKRHSTPSAMTGRWFT